MWDIREYWYEEGEEKGREVGREEGCDETLEAFDLVAKGVNTIKGLIENGISQKVAEKVIART